MTLPLFFTSLAEFHCIIDSGDAFAMSLLDLRDEGEPDPCLSDEPNRAVTFLRRRLASVAKNAASVGRRDSREKDGILGLGEGEEEVSEAAEGGRPRFTSEALSFLQRFVMSVRQSFDGGGGGGGYRSAAIASLVQLLVTLASSSARLMLRRTVEEFPDCTLAILLSHATLKNRLEASGYHNACVPDCSDLGGEGDDGPMTGGQDEEVSGCMLGSRLYRLHHHLSLTLQQVAAPTGSLVDGFDWPSEEL